MSELDELLAWWQSLNLVLVAIGQHGQKTGTFDGSIELTLKKSTGAGQPCGNDLAVFCNEIAQGVNIFVIDLGDTGYRKTAKAFALEKQILGRALGALVFVVKTSGSGHDESLIKINGEIGLKDDRESTKLATLWYLTRVPVK